MIPLRLGCCCTTITLRYGKDGIFGSRSVTLKTLKDKGIEVGEERALKNIADLHIMIQWLFDRGVHVFRLPSDMIPHGSNKVIKEMFDERGMDYLKLKFCREQLVSLGALVNKLGVRVTFHPGQYNQLGAQSLDVLQKTFYELNMHCRILDIMGVDKNGVMVIHGGGTYGDIDATIKRFIHVTKKLPDHIKRRLVLENDEKCYSPDDLIKICEATDTPLVFDIHHYVCYEINHPGKQTSLDIMIPRILETWKKRGLRPKFHISEQDPEKRIGAHSFFIETIQDVLLEIPEKYGVDFDLMIEAKGKELAIAKLYQKYPQLRCDYKSDIEIAIPKKGMKDFGKYL